MNEKFKNVSVEVDTKIITQIECKIADYAALYQTWVWDGIFGESIIFTKEDVAHLNDEEVKQLVTDSKYYQSAMGNITFSRGKSNFVFVNFNFQSMD